MLRQNVVYIDKKFKAIVVPDCLTDPFATNHRLFLINPNNRCLKRRYKEGSKYPFKT